MFMCILVYFEIFSMFQLARVWVCICYMCECVCKHILLLLFILSFAVWFGCCQFVVVFSFQYRIAFPTYRTTHSMYSILYSLKNARQSIYQHSTLSSSLSLWVSAVDFVKKNDKFSRYLTHTFTLKEKKVRLIESERETEKERMRFVFFNHHRMNVRSRSVGRS